MGVDVKVWVSTDEIDEKDWNADGVRTSQMKYQGSAYVKKRSWERSNTVSEDGEKAVNRNQEDYQK